VSKNVELLAVVGFAIPRAPAAGKTLGLAPKQTDPDYLVQRFFGSRIPDDNKSDMVKIHPGLQEGRSTVLHRHGVDRRYAGWCRGIKGQFFARGLAIAKTQRNPPPVFGAGLIDALPDAVFSETAERQLPEVRGRVHRIKDGRIGRFGWKAQIATLRDFVLSACANELGLEVPGHHQAPLASGPRRSSARVGHDGNGMRRPGQLRQGTARSGRRRSTQPA
jgi:hypothetical protein